MKPQRKVDICQSCNEEAEIAAHGLCFRCYRRCERQALYEKDGWNPGDTRKQKRLARAHAKLIEGLLDFGAGTHANATSLINILAGELMPLAEYLGSDVDVNNGQGSRSQDDPEMEEGRGEPDVNIKQGSRSQGEAKPKVFHRQTPAKTGRKKKPSQPPRSAAAS